MNQMIRFEKEKLRAGIRLSMPVRLTMPARLSIPMLAAATLGSLLLAGCASTPKPPDQALQAAEMAITTAEQARVADYASPELGEARKKIAAAHSAVQEKNMVLAERLAVQAQLDAELAVAKAGVGKAGAVNTEMQKSTDTIKQEMQRNPGVQP